MEVFEQQLAKILILRPIDRLDSTSLQKFSDHAKMKIQNGVRALILDLSELNYMSSAGIRILTMIDSTIQSFKGNLLICGLNPQVKELFELACLDQVYKIFPDKKVALKALLGGKDISAVQEQIPEKQITL